MLSERHSETHLTSLAEFGSSPFQDGGNKIHFTRPHDLLGIFRNVGSGRPSGGGCILLELDVSFRTNKSITTEQRIFS